MRGTGQSAIQTLDHDTPPERQLWCEVLNTAIDDAIHGSGDNGTIQTKINQTQAARRYLTEPNQSCTTVCYLAGVDPEAFYPRMRKRIAELPPAEEVVASKGRKSKKHTYLGRRLTCLEWSELTGLPTKIIKARFGDGWSPERALTTPYTSKGRTITPKPITPLTPTTANGGDTGEGQSCAA